MNQLDGIQKEDAHHILVWMPNWIGDVVFSLPTVQALRAHFSQSRITAVVRSPANEILYHHPDIDSVIKIPFSEKDGLGAQVRFARSLKKYRFDGVVLFPHSIRSAFLAYLSGARWRIGYATETRRCLLTHAIPMALDSKKVHAVDYYLPLVAPLGVTRVERNFRPVGTEEDMRLYTKHFLDLGIRKSDFVVAVQPGASKPQKRWHAERFGILCQRLIKEKEATVILLGSLGETEVIEHIKKFCPEDRVVTAIGLNLHLVLGLLKRSQLLIANDSGIMNLAAMVGTPLVAIFGPGNILTSDPVIEPEKKEIVTKNYPCSPCRQNFFKECDPSPHQKPYCIEDISVNDVAEAVEKLLSRI